MGKVNSRWSGFTLLELLLASSITSLVLGGLFLGASALLRTFRASEYQVTKLSEQLRFLDFLALDLRRAITVDLHKSSPSLGDPDIIELTIPDYYTTDSGSGKLIPRDPVIVSGVAVYGANANNPNIRYSVANGVLFRSQTDRSSGVSRTVNQVLCNDVSEFEIKCTSAGQIISSSVSFIPKFQWRTNTNPSYRAGTAAFTTILLRNTRITSTP